MKNLYTLLIALAATTAIHAQENPVEQKWKLKASYSRFDTGERYGSGTASVEKYIIGNYRLEAGYRINKAIEAGLLVGYGRTTLNRRSVFSTTRSHIIFYGVSANLQLLPLLIKKDGLRPEIYLRGEIGGHSYTNSIRRESVHEFDYGIGGGAAYYLWKRVGLNFEYVYGAQMGLRYGVAFKF